VNKSEKTKAKEREEITEQSDGSMISKKKTMQKQVIEALKKTGGNCASAARVPGIGRTTLYRLLKEYDWS
jgi:transcriptional regulator of acetoin/glycerol metabolism